MTDRFRFRIGRCGECGGVAYYVDGADPATGEIFYTCAAHHLGDCPTHPGRLEQPELAHPVGVYRRNAIIVSVEVTA